MAPKTPRRTPRRNTRSGDILHTVQTVANTAAALGRAVNQVRLGAQNGSRARDPAHIVDSTQTAETLYSKKRKISKRKIKRVKFAKKINEALREDYKISTWQELGNTTTATGYIMIRNPSTNDGGIQNDINQFFTSASNNAQMLVINGGGAWTATGGIRKYPYGVYTQVDAAGGNPENFVLHTTHVVGNLRLHSVQNICPIWVNVYVFTAAQQIENSNESTIAGVATNMIAAWTAYPTAGYNTEVAFNRGNTTPLDFPGMGAYWKQESKTRIYMGPGAQTEMIVPRLRRCTFKKDECETNVWAIKGKTQCVFITVDGLTGQIPVDTDVLKVSLDMTYHYKPKWTATGDRPVSEAVMTRISM